MTEYIHRDMAIARLTKVEVTEKIPTMAHAKRAITDMPAADVEPVVRCKNCRNLRQSGTGWYCCEYGGMITPQDYCSRAERITNVEAPQRVPWEAD